jgi:dihydrofolate synthase/folylpolyglutamate synthase
MDLSTLSEWMTWIETLHSTEIDLGLERIKLVAGQLGVLTFNCPIIVVAGTNGKGSTVFGLEAIYRSAGYKTGLFTSPILFKQNEQVRINGCMVSDERLCQAFAQVADARKEVPLTPFEFCTLAAFTIYKQQSLDILILEVGLGGRLDAVNIVNPDLSIVTSIDLDHMDWLGDTREKIAYEKAGIFRENRPAICGDFHPPQTLIDVAIEKKSPLYCQGRDFNAQLTSSSQWSWNCNLLSKHYTQLPTNTLALQNMSIVLMAITLLQFCLPVQQKEIEIGLKNVELPGRIQHVPGLVSEIYDVSHNPAAIHFLHNHLEIIPGKTFAVFSMLKDKDILNSLLAIKDKIDLWFVAPLQTKRATPLEALKTSFQQAAIQSVMFFSTIQEAYEQANTIAKPGDRIIIFGSFHTVADVWRIKTITQ